MAEFRSMELLAPAGNPAVALSAFDAGADAVYCGLQKFNARERSENFTHDELSRIIAYAHKLHRKIYVTFNTLLKESELDEAAHEMAFLAEVRPDAVIVQNLGAARMIREYFPDLELHASTQLGIHNSAGLEMAKKFGFRRVILERQVTLEELRKMIPGGAPPVEMELFIHGALCCCVSGSCLFSSWMGGWSGNRGKCKQPCRRRYFPADAAEKAQGEFLFSPDDLCSLELLDEFRRLGICSLKIEGRLRRADYVEKVVRAYRMVLDAPPDNRKDALDEARRILRGVVTRKTSAGFYLTESMRGLIRLDSFGGSGIPCGRVKRVLPGGFEAEISGRIHVGDNLRIQRDSDTGDGVKMTVLYMEKDRTSVLKIQNGERCFIRSDSLPAPGDLIYRTGEAGADLSARIARLPDARIPLDLNIFLYEKSLAVQVAGSALAYEAEFSPLAPAHTHAVSPDDLKKAFATAGSEHFEAGNMTVSVSGGWFLPAGMLKNLRQTFWHWAEMHVPRDIHRRNIADSLRRFHADREFLVRSVPPEKYPDCTAVGKDGRAVGITARDIDCADPSDEIILPPFVPETQLQDLKRKIDSLLDQGAGVFRITSFFQFALFPEKQDPPPVLKTMFPYPVCNSQDILVCREFGAACAQAWIELAQRDFDDLLKGSVLPLEAYRYGRPFIFMTRAVLPRFYRKIRDGRGHGFELEKEGALTLVYPDDTLSIPIPEGYSCFQDLRKCRDGARMQTDFNFSREWA